MAGMGHGKVVFESTPDDLKSSEVIRRKWLKA